MIDLEEEEAGRNLSFSNMLTMSKKWCFLQRQFLTGRIIHADAADILLTPQFPAAK